MLRGTLTGTSPRHALTLMSGIREATIARSASDSGVSLFLDLTGLKFRGSKVLFLVFPGRLIWSGEDQLHWNQGTTGLPQHDEPDHSA